MELWHVPAWRMRPLWPADGSEFISHYEYHVNGAWERREKDDVVHFADRLNFETRRGTSRLAGVLREVLSDNEAAAYTAHILKNMGVPGVIIGPKDGQFPIPDPARDRIEAMYTSKFTGTNRGRPLVSSDALDIHQVSFSPEQLALDKMRSVPASRICAALRLHPAVVHLGMDTTSGTLDNGGQHESARKAAYEDCLLPIGQAVRPDHPAAAAARLPGGDAGQPVPVEHGERRGARRGRRRRVEAEGHRIPRGRLEAERGAGSGGPAAAGRQRRAGRAVPVPVQAGARGARIRAGREAEGAGAGALRRPAGAGRQPPAAANGSANGAANGAGRR